MSRSETSTGVGFAAGSGPERLERIDDEGEVQAFLDVVDDADCRTVLEATSDEALSAGELSEACDLPLSTTYRKVELLDDVGALAERTRLRPSGKHTSEYRRALDSVVVSLDQNGDTELFVSMRDVEQ